MTQFEQTEAWSKQRDQLHQVVHNLGSRVQYLHHLQWVDTAEKAQRSLLHGGTATRTTLVLVTCCIVVFVVFFKLPKAC